MHATYFFNLSVNAENPSTRYIHDNTFSPLYDKIAIKIVFINKTTPFVYCLRSLIKPVLAPLAKMIR